MAQEETDYQLKVRIAALLNKTRVVAEVTGMLDSYANVVNQLLQQNALLHRENATLAEKLREATARPLAERRETPDVSDAISNSGG